MIWLFVPYLSHFGKPLQPVSKCTIPNCVNITNAIQSGSDQKNDLSAHRSCAEWGWAWSQSVLCYRRRLWVSEWEWNGRRVDARLLLAMNEWERTTVGNVDRPGWWDWFWPSRQRDARGHAALLRLRRGSWAGPVAWQPTEIARDMSGGEDYTVIRLQGHTERVREKFTTAEYRVSCSWLNFIHQGVYWMGRRPWTGSGKGCWWAGWTGWRQDWGGREALGSNWMEDEDVRDVKWVCCGSCSDVSVFHGSPELLCL